MEKKEKKSKENESAKEFAMKNVKKSEIFKIEAVITEAMESAGIEINNNVALSMGHLPDYVSMAFTVNNASLSTLNKVQKTLGNDFSILIAAAGKGKLIIKIEAFEDTFIALLKGYESNDKLIHFES